MSNNATDKNNKGATSAPLLCEAVDPLLNYTQNLAVICSNDFVSQSSRLAEQWGVEWLGVCDPAEVSSFPMVVKVDASGLSLCATGPKGSGPVRCDFVSGSTRHRRLYGGGKSQTIAKAIGIKDSIRPKVADLTAGLGGDSFVLASLGATVQMVERHPVVAKLLADGLFRARKEAENDAQLAVTVARLSFLAQPAQEWLKNIEEHQRPDVIYLDPMFPEKKKSAQVKKSMQAFQQIVGGDDDADGLLPAALEKARFRVVVKRPIHAPCLNQQQPGYVLKGKSVRFDIYPLKKMV